MDKEKIKNFIISQRENGVPDDQIYSFLIDKGAIPAPQPPQEDGLIKTIAKDVAETLLVKPTVRATEAVTRLVSPNSLAAKGYESMADEGQSQNIGGIEVEPVKAFGEGGGKQIVGEGLKTASYLFPYGKVAGVAGKTLGKIGGNVASGATGGYLADVGYGLTDKEQTTGEALTPGLGTAIGSAVPLVGPALRATGRGIAKTGEKMVESVIPVSKREAGILQTYKANNPFFKRVADVLAGTEKAPTTAGKTATRTTAGQTLPGLFGTKSQIGVQAKRASNSLWQDVISPRLKASEQAVDLDGFFAKVEDDIIKNNPELTRRNSLLEALNAVREDYAGTKVVSLEGLQKLKEGWAKFIPEKAYQGKPIAGAFNDVRNELANEARQTIYSQLGDDVKQAYFDYGNLQGLIEMGQVSMTGQKLKGGTGGLVSELFSQAITPVGTIGGQAVYRIGKGIEFIGNLGAKNLGEALGIQGGLKFPGDIAVDDIGKRVDDFKKLPRKVKQGGYIGVGQDSILPTNTQNSQTAAKISNNSISNTIPPKGLKGKGTIPEIADSIKQAKASGQSFDEWVKGIRGSATQYGEYTPQLRKFGMEDYKNITELGVKPDKMITIYRGIDDTTGKLPRKINDGDFVTTDFESAKSYATSAKDIVSMKVPAKTLYTDAVEDFSSEPFYTGAEYVYTKEKINPPTRSQLKAEWDKTK